MNDTMSLVLATTILATGGLCLYMYKSSNEDDPTGDENYYAEDNNEDNSFSFANFFNTDDEDKNVNDKNNDEDEDNYEKNDDEELEMYEPKTRQRGGGKTKRNRKSTGSKRRY